MGSSGGGGGGMSAAEQRRLRAEDRRYQMEEREYQRSEERMRLAAMDEREKLRIAFEERMMVQQQKVEMEASRQLREQQEILSDESEEIAVAEQAEGPEGLTLSFWDALTSGLNSEVDNYESDEFAQPE